MKEHLGESPSKMPTSFSLLTYLKPSPRAKNHQRWPPNTQGASIHLKSSLSGFQAKLRARNQITQSTGGPLLFLAGSIPGHAAATKCFGDGCLQVFDGVLCGVRCTSSWWRYEGVLTWCFFVLFVFRQKTATVLESCRTVWITRRSWATNSHGTWNSARLEILVQKKHKCLLGLDSK